MNNQSEEIIRLLSWDFIVLIIEICSYWLIVNDPGHTSKQWVRSDTTLMQIYDCRENLLLVAAPGPSNQVERRVVDDLVNFNGETSMPKVMKFFFGQQIEDMRGFVTHIRKEAHTSRNCIAQLTALVHEIEAIDDEENMFDTLICLRDDTWDENNKLMELNRFIAQVEERIAIKEEHVRVMEASGDDA
nr:hypothetical protein [Tanacetum cinerariifolium]